MAIRSSTRARRKSVRLAVVVGVFVSMCDSIIIRVPFVNNYFIIVLTRQLFCFILSRMGRRMIPLEQRRVILSTYVQPKTGAILKALAKAEDRSLAEVVAEFIETHPGFVRILTQQQTIKERNA